MPKSKTKGVAATADGQRRSGRDRTRSALLLEAEKDAVATLPKGKNPKASPPKAVEKDAHKNKDNEKADGTKAISTTELQSCLTSQHAELVLALTSQQSASSNLQAIQATQHSELMTALATQQSAVQGVLEEIKAQRPAPQHVTPPSGDGITPSVPPHITGSDMIDITADDTIDLLNQQLRSRDQSEPRPMNHLVCAIPIKLRRDIYSGSFFDLGRLIDKSHSSAHKITLNLDAATPSVDIERRPTIQGYNLAQWRDAFMKYIACLTHKDPTIASDLLAYMNTIEEMAIDFHNSNAWSFYDVLFRQQLAVNGWDWTHHDSRTYNKAASKFIGQSNSQPLRQPRPASSDQRPGRSLEETDHRKEIPSGFCRDFGANRCNRNPCSYRHICFKCNKEHASITCNAHHAESSTRPHQNK